MQTFYGKNKQLLSFLSSSFATVVRMLKCVSFTVSSHVPLLYRMYPIWIKLCATNPKMTMFIFTPVLLLHTRNQGDLNKGRFSTLLEQVRGPEANIMRITCN